jgi:hypothetical protein
MMAKATVALELVVVPEKRAVLTQLPLMQSSRFAHLANLRSRVTNQPALKVQLD